MPYRTVTVFNKRFPFTDVQASPFNADNTGVVGCSAALEQIKAYFANKGPIYFSEGTYLIDADLTIPVGMQPIIPKGTVLKIATGKTLTMPIPDAGLYQIFDCQGTGKVVFSGGGEAYPQWWGDCSVDGSNHLSAALNASYKTRIVENTTVYAVNVEVGSNKHLVVDGTLKMPGASPLGSHLLKLGSSSNIKITGDGILDGNKANQSGGSLATDGMALIVGNGCSYITIDIAKAQNNYYPSSFSIDYDKVSSCIEIRNGDHINVSVGLLYMYEREGIFLYNCTNSSITNTVTWGTADPLGENNGDSYSGVQANIYKGVVHNVRSYWAGASGIGCDSHDVVISDCLSYKNKYWAGFNFGHDLTRTKNITANNLISIGAGWGDVTGNSHGFNINMVEVGKYSGIFSNLISIDAKDRGINISNLAGEVIINGAYIQNPGTFGIHVYLVDGVILSNIYVDGAGAEGCRFLNCNISVDNIIVTNGATEGIHILDNATVCKLSNFRIINNASYGLKITNTPTVFTHNGEITNNNSGGIQIDYPSRAGISYGVSINANNNFTTNGSFHCYRSRDFYVQALTTNNFVVTIGMTTDSYVYSIKAKLIGCFSTMEYAISKEIVVAGSVLLGVQKDLESVDIYDLGDAKKSNLTCVPSISGDDVVLTFSNADVGTFLGSLMLDVSTCAILTSGHLQEISVVSS